MPTVLRPRAKADPPTGSRGQEALGWILGILFPAGVLGLILWIARGNPASRPTGPEIPSSPQSAIASTSIGGQPLGYVVKGNISYTTGERLYHVPGMRDYEITEIDPTRGERWFKSETEAQAAGWVRADAKLKSR